MDKRGSGILLHIASLPSSYGVGDLGPEAYRFADFLAKTKQAYWQVLPLNPTNPVYGNSPYSSISAFAGNTLLISPDLLFEEGFLPMQDLLGLGGEARMNGPSIAHGNWEWRLLPGQITASVSETLLEVTETFGRAGRWAEPRET